MKNSILNKFQMQNVVFLLLNALVLLGSGVMRTIGASYIQQITDALERLNLKNVLVGVLVGGTLMALSYVARWIAAGICTYLTEKLAVGLRLKMIEHFEQVPFLQYEKFSTGSLQSIMRNDVSQASNIIYIIHSRILTNVFLFVVAISYMIYVNPFAGSFVAVFAVVLGIVNQKILKNIKTYEKNIRASVSNITNSINNTFVGMDTVKTYNAGEYVMSFFHDEKKHYNKNSMKTANIDSWRMTLYNIIQNLAFYGSLIYLGILGIKEIMSLGEILVFLTLLRQVMTPIETIFRWMATLVRSNASWDRIYDHLRQEEIRIIEDKETVTNMESLSVENITFKYPDGNIILNRFKIWLEKGKLSILSGESGSGKTTLFKILLGLYPCETAEFKIDNKKQSQNDLSNLFSLTLGDKQLFNLSIYENIALGDSKITKQLCMDAFDKLGLKSWVLSLPDGLDTIVSDNASNLSGGQQQVISIIRAILHNRPIIIMDEPFSALDKERERLLISWLNEVKKDHLILVISHRESTLENSDVVIKIA